MSYPLRKIFLDIFDGTHHVYQNILWAERMREVDPKVLDVVTEKSDFDYRSLDRFPHEQNLPSEQGVATVVLRSIHSKGMNESQGIGEMLDSRFFFQTPLRVCKAMASALELLVCRTEKMDAEQIQIISRWGKTPNKFITQWVDRVDRSFQQFRHLKGGEKLIRLQLSGRNNIKQWEQLFKSMFKNFELIEKILTPPEGTRPDVSTTTFTTPEGYIGFFLNPAHEGQTPQSLVEVFSSPLGAAAAHNLQNERANPEWRKWVNSHTEEEGNGWFDVAMLLIDQEISKQMFDGETTPWNEALNMLTPSIANFTTPHRKLFMDLLHCAGFPGMGFPEFKLQAYQGAQRGDPFLPEVTGFTKASQLKVGTWAIDTSNLNYILEAAKVLAVRKPIPPTFVPKPSVPRVKRQKVEAEPAKKEENNSSIWLLGGAVVLIFAFIRS